MTLPGEAGPLEIVYAPPRDPMKGHVKGWAPGSREICIKRLTYFVYFTLLTVLLTKNAQLFNVF